jgi:hypothetical protein
MCTTLSFRRAILAPRSQTQYSLSCRIGLLHRLSRLIVKICRVAKNGKKIGAGGAYTSAAIVMSKGGGSAALRSTSLVSYGPYGRDHRRCLCRGRGGAQG